MKTTRTLIAFILCLSLLFGATSCLVVVPGQSGRNGWGKNTNNPHHPHSTNPGHAKGKSRN